MTFDSVVSTLDRASRDGERGDAVTQSWFDSLRVALLGVILALVAGMGAAQAQNGSAGTSNTATNDWTFQVTPYLWMPSLTGSITGQSGRSASFDIGIGDVLSKLDGGFMLLGEARHKRWGILADFDFAKLSGNGEFGPIFGEPSASLHEYIGTLEGGYRFIDSDTFKLDGLAGFRVMSLGIALNFSGSGLAPPLSQDGGLTWADPLVGLRVIVPIGATGFFLNGFGDYGGGWNNQLTYQLYGGIGYNFNQTISAYVGYRRLTMKQEGGSGRTFSVDINQQGPLIGVGIRF